MAVVQSVDCERRSYQRGHLLVSHSTGAEFSKELSRLRLVSSRETV